MLFISGINKGWFDENLQIYNIQYNFGLTKIEYSANISKSL